MNRPSTLFRLSNLTSGDSFHTWFQNLDWEVKTGEVWCVLGGNGSGKSLLSALLRGELPLRKGSLSAPWLPSIPDTPLPALVSFEAQKALMDYERWNDDSEFLEGGLDPGRSVEALVGGENPWLQDLGLKDLKDRGIKLLSSGEFRRALLARELNSRPPLLILDEPYEALDRDSCRLLEDLWPRLPGPQLFLLQRPGDIPSHTTHLLFLDQGKILRSGPREDLSQEEILRLMGLTGAAFPPLPTPLPELTQTMPPDASLPLVEMEEVTVRYGEKIVLDKLSWKVFSGEHWVITGPNGCGKSTLLSLINGENQQAFREKVHIFGRRRGTGESLWDIRRLQGVVSPALHQAHDHNLDQPLWAVTAGGLFDTIGLYETLSWDRRQYIQQWLEVFGLDLLAQKSFTELSYGQQRLALLVRALVKEPPLLVLDEPCQGLDMPHTLQFLQAVDHIAAQGRSTVLLVTHRPEERLNCLKNHLDFQLSEAGPAIIQKKVIS